MRGQGARARRSGAWMWRGAVVVAVVGSAVAARPAAAQVRQIGGQVGISLYTDARFRGRSANVREDVADLGRINMSSAVSSFRVAGGGVWEGCDQPYYRGTCQTFSGEEIDLGPTGWNDRLRSIRRLRGGGGGGGGGGWGGSGGSGTRLELFDQPNYRGRSRVVTGSDQSIAMGRVGSVRVRGRWQLCGANFYRGACAEVDRDQSYVESSLGLATVRSARPQ